MMKSLVQLCMETHTFHELSCGCINVVLVNQK